MPFSGISGHSGAISALRRILRSGRVAHAYLFIGPEGIGKKKVATAFIEALFCGREEGCGTCISCLKIASGNHPDIHHLEADGQFIKVDHVRELQKELALRPYEAKRKACIIDGADRFNPSSGNSLLKTLEEPPGNALVILLSSRADGVLSTIRSRCQQISFAGIPEDDIAKFLQQQGVDAENARAAASLSEGSMARAMHLGSVDLLADRSELISSTCKLSSHSMTGLLAYTERFDKDREKTLQSLGIIISFWRDMLHMANGSAEFVNRDLSQLIGQETARRSTDRLLSELDAMAKTRQAILRNANVRLAMDVLCMQLAI